MSNIVNVGSIEEDIKILENLIVTLPNFHLGGSESIRNILQDYKRQKQINEEHQKINGALREQAKELDTKNNELLKDLYSANCIIADLTDSIPIQKIQDKIEELDRKIRYEKNERVLIYLHKQKKVLQELLQESEDK